MYRNNDFIYEATSKLEQLINIPIDIDSSRQNYDALLRIKNEQFIVEAKSAVRTSNQGLVLSQLEEMKQNNNRPIILIAEYISKTAAEEFKNRDINYIDIAGNAYIKFNDLVIFIEGQKKAKKERTNQSRAFQEAGLKILFQLLYKPEHLQDSYRKIAEKADVSIGSVSNVMAELEDLNYLLKTSDKRVLKNKNELIERWIVAFNAVLRPRIMRKRMRFLDNDFQQQWRNIDTHINDGYVLWGGEPGAAILTENLRPEKFTLFTNLDLSEVARSLKLVPSEKGDVEILQKFWNNNSEKKKTAPALLIYADLINSGFGRNIETAKQILENELNYI
ncbi:type IV toxin-antitoxin system AbiEi family antitoxin [Mariniflexile sp. AS56]|uniref:type IV toxin-antitoxin system AbiEi family antitoxin n=1 Tax=Mariniflexile sp. AS56 TaxID=3063957 RepID=UPI0026F0FDB2|nr:type IV toxin-antitoxin system AbiEi family antitoxin [Mariniflexile sp. AS56]MDO7173889.1 type IV toxin-antitoxin system AbiEi family antitoxin [Mariniflexile sp. AS56]